MKRDNATCTLICLIKELGVPLTGTTLAVELEQHPDATSMLAFADVLRNFGITSGVYKLPYAELGETPLPFICQLADHSYALVASLGEEQAILSNEKWHDKAFSTWEFKSIYAGSVLTVESIEGGGEPKYADKRRIEVLESLRQPVTVTLLAFVALILYLHYSHWLQNLNLPLALLTLFKTAGLATTILLLIQSIGTNNPLVQKLCGGDDGTNCNTILSSPAAKAATWLSWSELGLFYFAGSWLALVFNSGNIALIQALAILNICCLPYTFYSIYYQWQIAKQWCRLCCTVQGLLWLESFAFLSYLNRPLQLSHIQQWAWPALWLLALVCVWIVLKPWLLLLAGLPETEAHLRHFMRNRELFEAAAKSGTKYATPGSEWSMALGNPEAANVITLISNPFCGHCPPAHQQVEEALMHDANLQVRVLFTGSSDNPNDDRSKVQRRLMALYALPDKGLAFSALHDWYAQPLKNYPQWGKAHPLPVQVDEEAVTVMLQKQREWLKLTGITGTPIILLNGYKLPKAYRLKDLKYMLYG